MNDQNPKTPSSKALLVTVWLIVALPALWGVSKTVETSMKLFHTPAATQPATDSAAATAATAPAAAAAVPATGP